MFGCKSLFHVIGQEGVLGVFFPVRRRFVQQRRINPGRGREETQLSLPHIQHNPRGEEKKADFSIIPTGTLTIN